MRSERDGDIRVSEGLIRLAEIVQDSELCSAVHCIRLGVIERAINILLIPSWSGI